MVPKPAFWGDLELSYTMTDTAGDTLDRDDTLLLNRVSQDKSKLAYLIEATALSATDPHAHKVMRTFLPRDAAELVGVTAKYFNTVAAELELEVERDDKNKYRAYSLSNINDVRKELARRNADSPKAVRYDPQRREDDDLAVVAFVNFKGGSAKTTSSVHFAQYAALQGYRVLLLDLDPQGSASTMFGYEPVMVEADQSVNAALRYEEPISLREVVQKTYFEGVDICLGGQWMAEWEQDTPRVMTDAKHYGPTAQQQLPKLRAERARGGLTEARMDEMEQEIAAWEHIVSVGDSALHYYMRLRQALNDVKDDYDIVVCDTQPALHFASQATIGAANHLVLTIQPEWLDIKSMHQYLSNLEVHLATLADHTDVIGQDALYTDKTMHYLLTRYEQNDAAMASITQMMRGELESVLEHPMPKTTVVSQAGLLNCTIYEGSGKDFNRETYKRGIEAMNNVNREIEEIVLKGWGRDL